MSKQTIEKKQRLINEVYDRYLSILKGCERYKDEKTDKEISEMLDKFEEETECALDLKIQFLSKMILEKETFISLVYFNDNENFDNSLESIFLNEDYSDIVSKEVKERASKTLKYIANGLNDQNGEREG
ncbi:MAG: hypothetical protein IKN17_09145 [Ruminococcus sp.]|nr:hypothetical protein [Ruminococcus sp.]